MAERTAPPRRATRSYDRDNPRRPGVGWELVSVATVMLAIGAGLYLLALREPTWLRIVAGVAVGGVVATLRIALLKRCLLTAIILEMPLAIDAYIGHDAFVAAENAISGYNVSVTTIALALLCVLWAMEQLADRMPRPVVWRPGIPALTYFAVVVASVLVAEDALRSSYEIVMLGQAVVLYFYIIHAVSHRRDVVFVMILILAGVILQGLVTVGAGVLGIRGSLGPIEIGSLGGRFSGTLGHPNTLGTYLVFLLTPALAASTTLPTRGQRLIAASAFGIGSIALMLTGSRGSLIGTALSVAIFGRIGIRRGWLTHGKAFSILAAGMLVLAFTSAPTVQRLGEYDSATGEGRLPLLTLAYSVIGESPIVGVGTNNYAVAMKDYVTVDHANAWLTTVHNKYLLVWGETGIVGLLAFLWMLFSALRIGFSGRHWHDPLLGSLSVAFSSALVGIMTHMFVAIYHARMHTQFLWLEMGLVAALSHMHAVEYDPVSRRQGAGQASNQQHALDAGAG